MSPNRLAGALALTLALASGCDACGAESAAERESAGRERQRPRQTTEDVPTPTAEQLPLPQDYAEHAAQTVTDETYLAEIERIAGELGVEATPPSADEQAEPARPSDRPARTPRAERRPAP